MRVVVVPPDYTPSGSPLSPAVRAGSLVFVSGQTASGEGGVEMQTRAVLEKMKGILIAAGSDLSQVLRCGVYLADIRTFQRMNSVYREFFPAEPPARTTIECKMADSAVLVEIDCVATVG